MLQCIIDRTFLWFAYVFFEICLQLFFGLIGIEQELMPRSEHKPANVTVRHAGSNTDEFSDLKISLRHTIMMAGARFGRQSGPMQSRKSLPALMVGPGMSFILWGSPNSLEVRGPARCRRAAAMAY